MALPLTGSITQKGDATRHGIQTEWGGPATPIPLSSYYKDGTLVDLAQPAPIAAAGTQLFSNYRGASKIVAIAPGALTVANKVVDDAMKAAGFGPGLTTPNPVVLPPEVGAEWTGQVTGSGPQGATPRKFTLNGKVNLPGALGGGQMVVRITGTERYRDTGGTTHPEQITIQAGIPPRSFGFWKLPTLPAGSVPWPPYMAVKINVNGSVRTFWLKLNQSAFGNFYKGPVVAGGAPARTSGGVYSAYHRLQSARVNMTTQFYDDGPPPPGATQPPPANLGGGGGTGALTGRKVVFTSFNSGTGAYTVRVTDGGVGVPGINCWVLRVWQTVQQSGDWNPVFPAFTSRNGGPAPPTDAQGYAKGVLAMPPKPTGAGVPQTYLYHATSIAPAERNGPAGSRTDWGTG